MALKPEDVNKAVELLGVSKEKLIQILFDEGRFDEVIDIVETLEDAHLVHDLLEGLGHDWREQQFRIRAIWENLSSEAVASVDEKTSIDDLHEIELHCVYGKARDILDRLVWIDTGKRKIRESIQNLRRYRKELVELRTNKESQ